MMQLITLTNYEGGGPYPVITSMKKFGAAAKDSGLKKGTFAPQHLTLVPSISTTHFEHGNAAWPHPVVRDIDKDGPCYGPMKCGDQLVSIEATTRAAKRLDTRCAADKPGGSSTVVTSFLKMAVGKVRILVHRPMMRQL